MPALILHQSAIVLCSHFGLAKPLLPNPRVTLSGQPVVTIASPYSVAACGLSTTTTPPCVSGQFSAGATRVTAGGAFVAILSGASSCLPTGTPLVPLLTQFRVTAT